MVNVNGVYKSVELQGRMVEFLIDLNENCRNEDKIDKPFIKTLLIAVLSVKAIKANEDFDEGYVSFIKGALNNAYNDLNC